MARRGESFARIEKKRERESERFVCVYVRIGIDCLLIDEMMDNGYVFAAAIHWYLPGIVRISGTVGSLGLTI